MASLGIHVTDGLKMFPAEPYSLFAGTKEYPRLASVILSALQEETAEGDMEHLCEMTA